MYKKIKEQFLAASPKYSVFLKASAGTGKTKVLVDRMLRFLCEGCDIRKILCLTYTNAAATLMIERISKKLEHWYNASDIELKQELFNLLQEDVSGISLNKIRGLYVEFPEKFSELNIQTLHSFCLQMFKKFMHEERGWIEITILSETEKRSVIMRYLSSLMNSEEDTIEKSSLLSLMSEYNLKQIISVLEDIFSDNEKLYLYLKKYSSLEEAVTSIYKMHNFSIEKDKVKINDIKAILPNNYEVLKSGISLVREELKTADTILDWLEASKSERAVLWRRYRKCFITPEGTVKKLFTKAFSEKYKDIAHLIEREAERVVEIDNRLRILNIVHTTKYYTSIVMGVNKYLERYKYKNVSFEYFDILSCFLKYITSSEAFAYGIYQNISHILVDEAQDLSSIAWEIIKNLTNITKEKKGTIFVVGDIKQSIYSFQGALPECFMSAEKYYSEFYENTFLSLELNISFRSLPNILSFVDNVFQSSIKTYHKAAREDGEGYTSSFNVELQRPTEKEDIILPKAEATFDDERRLARAIGSKVQGLLTQENILPEDILLLVRKRSAFVEKLVSELYRCGIDVNNLEKSDFRDTIVYQDLYSLIYFIKDKYDDLNLASLLKSPIIGFQEEDLFQLAIDRGKFSLWERLHEKNPEVASYLQGIIDFYLKTASVYLTVYNIIEKDKIGLEFKKRLGNDIESDINKFLFVIKENDLGLNSLLKYLEGISNVKRNTTLGEKKVTISTIHSAKGLEFKVVLLVDSWKEIRFPREEVLWHDEGFAINVKEGDKVLEKIKEDRKGEILAEEERLLYVALTRAKEKLFVCGYQGLAASSWYGRLEILLKNSEFMKVNNLTDKDIVYNQNVLKREKLKNIPYLSYNKSLVKKTKGEEFGELVHLMFYELAMLEKDDWDRHLRSRLKDRIDKSYIIELVMKNMGEFSWIFNGGEGECEFIQELEGNIYNIRLDRILIEDDIVTIIDFKTEKYTKKAHEKYLAQLSLYKRIISSIYKNKKIVCKILWVLSFKLEEIDSEYALSA